jgi:hypothetical protein
LDRSQLLAAGKSPSTGSGDPTTWNVVVVAEVVNTIFFFIFTNRIHRLARSGRSLTSMADPTISELEEVDRHTPELRGAPTPKGRQADTKHRATSTSTSMALPAGTLPSPTLYTGRDPWIPQPPAAGAAAGGGGIHESPASEVGRRGVLQIASLAL